MDNARKSFSESGIKICNRSSAEMTGVDEIVSYDEKTIVLLLCGTRTVIEGEDLRVTELSVEEGRICTVGRINALYCEDEIKRGKSMVSRLFKGQGS